MENMKDHHYRLAAFTLIVGFVTLILAVSALSEKSHEGHLPERNDRGTTAALASLTGLCAILFACRALQGTDRHRNDRILTLSSTPGHSCCPAMAGRAMTMRSCS